MLLDRRRNQVFGRAVGVLVVPMPECPLRSPSLLMGRSMPAIEVASGVLRLFQATWLGVLWSLLRGRTRA